MLFARCSFLGRRGVPSAATCHLAGPYGSKGLSYFDLKCRCSAHPGHREAYASSATAALPYAKPAIRVHREVHASPGRPRSFRNSLAPLTGDKGDNSSSRGKQAVHASPPVADAAQEASNDERSAQQAKAKKSAAAQAVAQRSRVRSASFMKSSTTLESCPAAVLPEFAVIGRSNVGKSSLINMLTGQKALALVSKTPGKTTCINHFLINDDWHLVDLPGYGYAKRSKSSRVEWRIFTQRYFMERPTLALVMLLVDASIPPQPADIDAADWLGNAQVPFTIVFTKTDKRKKKTPTAEQNIAAFKREMLVEWESLPPLLSTSCKNNTGKGELLAHIAQLRDDFRAEHPDGSFRPRRRFGSSTEKERSSERDLDQARPPEVEKPTGSEFDDSSDAYPAALVWDQADDPWPELREQQARGTH